MNFVEGSLVRLDPSLITNPRPRELIDLYGFGIVLKIEDCCDKFKKKGKVVTVQWVLRNKKKKYHVFSYKNPYKNTVEKLA